MISLFTGSFGDFSILADTVESVKDDIELFYDVTKRLKTLLTNIGKFPLGPLKLAGKFVAVLNTPINASYTLLKKFEAVEEYLKKHTPIIQLISQIQEYLGAFNELNKIIRGLFITYDISAICTIIENADLQNMIGSISTNWFGVSGIVTYLINPGDDDFSLAKIPLAGINMPILREFVYVIELEVNLHPNIFNEVTVNAVKYTDDIIDVQKSDNNDNYIKIIYASNISNQLDTNNVSGKLDINGVTIKYKNIKELFN